MDIDQITGIHERPTTAVPTTKFLFHSWCCMDRREFVKGSAGAVVGTALTKGKALANSKDGYVIENAQIAWRIEKSANGIRSVSLENRLDENFR